MCPIMSAINNGSCKTPKLSSPARHLLGGRQQAGPAVGQRGALFAALKQLAPEPLFQVRDSPTDCGLPQLQVPGGRAEAPLLGDRQKGLCVFPRYIHLWILT